MQIILAVGLFLAAAFFVGRFSYHAWALFMRSRNLVRVAMTENWRKEKVTLCRFEGDLPYWQLGDEVVYDDLIRVRTKETTEERDDGLMEVVRISSLHVGAVATAYISPNGEIRVDEFSAHSVSNRFNLILSIFGLFGVMILFLIVLIVLLF